MRCATISKLARSSIGSRRRFVGSMEQNRDEDPQIDHATRRTHSYLPIPSHSDLGQVRSESIPAPKSWAPVESALVVAVRNYIEVNRLSAFPDR